MLKKINVEEAVGTNLAHDITEIRPGDEEGLVVEYDQLGTEELEDLVGIRQFGKESVQFQADLEVGQVIHAIKEMFVRGALRFFNAADELKFFKRR